MSWLRLRRKDQAGLPIRKCFFCNEQSLILPSNGDPSSSRTAHGRLTDKPSSSDLKNRAGLSAGTVSSWHCSSCGSHNVASSTEPHGIASWTEQMAGDGSDRPSPATTPKKSRPRVVDDLNSDEATLNDAQKAHLFCHRCLTNQQVHITLLAQFGEPSAGQGPSLRHYKSDLHARYPLVCQDCRPKVEEQIERRNKWARRSIWRGWMEGRRQPSGTFSAAKTQLKRDQTHSQGHLSNHVNVKSILKLAVLLSGPAVTLRAQLDRVQQPIPLPPIPSSKKSWSALLLLSLVNLATATFSSVTEIASDMDPILDDGNLDDSPSAEQRDDYQRTIRRQLHQLTAVELVFGMLDSISSNEYAFFASLPALHPDVEAALRRVILLNETLQRISIILVLIQLSLLISAILTPRLQAANVRAGHNDSTSTFAAQHQASPPSRPDSGLDSLSTSLSQSLFPSPRMAPTDRFGETSWTHASTGGVVDQSLPEEVPMDWQPTTTDSASQVREEEPGMGRADDAGLQWGPQRLFAPEMPTGLEGRFAEGLTLGDKRDEQEEIGKGQRSHKMSMASLLVVLSAILVLLASACYVVQRRKVQDVYQQASILMTSLLPRHSASLASSRSDATFSPSHQLT